MTWRIAHADLLARHVSGALLAGFLEDVSAAASPPGTAAAATAVMAKEVLNAPSEEDGGGGSGGEDDKINKYDDDDDDDAALFEVPSGRTWMPSHKLVNHNSNNDGSAALPIVLAGTGLAVWELPSAASLFLVAVP